MIKEFIITIRLKKRGITDNPQTELEQYISRQIYITTYESFTKRLTQEQILNEVRYKCFHLWLQNTKIEEFKIRQVKNNIEIRFFINN